jgi:anti-anti-sigma regulatory factor
MAPAPLTSASVDANEATRRNTLVSRLSAGLASVMALYIVVALVVNRQGFDRLLLLFVLITCLYSGLGWLTRRRYSSVGPLLLVGATLVVAVTLSATTGGMLGPGPAILFVVLGIGSLVLRSGDSLLLGGLIFASLVLLAWLTLTGQAIPAQQTNVINITIVYGLLLGFMGVLCYANTRSHERAIRRMAEQTVAVAAQNEQLTSQQVLLGQQSAELAQQRELLEIEVQKRTAELQAALHELQQNAITLRELQTPLVPIAAGVLVLPVVGAFDRARATRFVGDLLVGIEERRAHTVLLDVTGLSVLDTLAAQTLIEAAQAARLLGAGLVLVGIGPSVANTIVGLGVDLRGLRIERDLQSAIEAVFWRIDHTKPGTASAN